MLMVAVLALITAAFFQAYRSHYSLWRASASSQAAGTACETLFHYVTYRLEHDRTWGSPAYDGSIPDVVHPDGIGLLDITPVNTHEFTGFIPSLDAQVSGQIYNNMGGAVPNAPDGTAVPPGKVLCRVQATAGTSTRQAEFLLTIAPLFDSSVLTRGNLVVDAGLLEIRSRDEDRNMIRTEGDMYIPNVLDGAENSQFLLPDGSTEADPNGMLWAKGDIYTYDGGAPEALDDGAEIGEAMQNIKGKIVPNADAHFSIYDLKEEDLRMPAGNTLVTDVEPGRWTFTRATAQVDYSVGYMNAEDWGEGLYDGDDVEVNPLNFQKTVMVDVLEYYDANQVQTPDVPEKVYRAEHRNDDILSQTPTNQNVGDDPGVIVPETLSISNIDILGYGTTVTLQDVVPRGGGKVRFDLLNQRVTIDADATVEVDGPFEVTSVNTQPPVLDLSAGGGLDADGTPQRAALIAGGTLNIENGVTEGLGTLISRGGDIKIQPINTGSLIAEADADAPGLVIFADQNVYLKNPNGTGDWDFRGLVYAREGIRMEGINTERATFEGTIVARRTNDPLPGAPDGIEFLHCNTIEFVYNPDLLTAFVEDLPYNRIQMEAVYWKS